MEDYSKISLVSKHVFSIQNGSGELLKILYLRYCMLLNSLPKISFVGQLSAKLEV